jgi:hypothetical protein
MFLRSGPNGQEASGPHRQPLTAVGGVEASSKKKNTQKRWSMMASYIFGQGKFVSLAYIGGHCRNPN